MRTIGLNNNSFVWEPATGIINPTSPDPIVAPVATTTYSLIATDEDGCKFSYPITINYSPSGNIAVPSAFSPNGDGHNDVFRILHVCNFQLDDFSIYNRWGEMIFETTLINGFWSGNDAPIGVYAYVIKGHTYQNEPVFMKGNVTLLR